MSRTVKSSWPQSRSASACREAPPPMSITLSFIVICAALSVRSEAGRAWSQLRVCHRWRKRRPKARLSQWDRFAVGLCKCRFAAAPDPHEPAQQRHPAEARRIMQHPHPAAVGRSRAPCTPDTLRQADSTRSSRPNAACRRPALGVRACRERRRSHRPERTSAHPNYIE
jgi:hypothetical protein